MIQNLSPRNTYFLFVSLALAIHALLLLGFDIRTMTYLSATEQPGIEIKLGMPSQSTEPQTREDTPIEPPSPQVVPPIPDSVLPTPAPKEIPTPVTPKPSRTKATAIPAPSTTQTQAEAEETSQPAIATAQPAPRYDNPKLPYPELARKRGQEGTVILEVEVDTLGRTLDVRVHRSSGYPLLDNAALKAIRKWRFTPANLNGKIVQGSLLLPIEFRLEN